MNPYSRLYSPDATATVRSGLTGTDAGTWTPNDETTPPDHALDAREWDTVRVWGGGSASSITLTPLLRVGADWVALATTGAITGAPVEVAVDGHFVSFRVTALTGTPASIKVTGGRKRRNLAGG